MNVVLHHYWTRQVAVFKAPLRLVADTVAIVLGSAWHAGLIKFALENWGAGNRRGAATSILWSIIWLAFLTAFLGSRTRGARPGRSSASESRESHPTLPLSAPSRALSEAAACALGYWVVLATPLLVYQAVGSPIWERTSAWAGGSLVAVCLGLGALTTLTIPLAAAQVLDPSHRSSIPSLRTLPIVLAVVALSLFIGRNIERFVEFAWPVSVLGLLLSGIILTGLVLALAPLLNRMHLPRLQPSTSSRPKHVVTPGRRYRAASQQIARLVTDAWHGGLWPLILLILAFEVLVLIVSRGSSMETLLSSLPLPPGSEVRVVENVLLVCWLTRAGLSLQALCYPLGIKPENVGRPAPSTRSEAAIARVWAVMPVSRRAVVGTYYVNTLLVFICLLPGRFAAKCLARLRASPNLLTEEATDFAFVIACIGLLMLAVASLLAVDTIGTSNQRRRWLILGLAAILFWVPSSLALVTMLAAVMGKAVASAAAGVWMFFLYPVLFSGGIAADLFWPRKREQAAW